MLRHIPNFEGTAYQLPNNWFEFVDLSKFMYRPITYLEIGAFYGASLMFVANSYGAHPESKLHCIDPWEDYGDYSEYKGQINNVHETFVSNLEKSGHKSKVTIHRGYSNTELPKLTDETFDIIYVDGNHEAEFVLEDAVLSFRKLKQGGIMIFDDYGNGDPECVKRGVDAFLTGYHKQYVYLGLKNQQVFIQKLYNFQTNISRQIGMTTVDSSLGKFLTGVSANDVYTSFLEVGTGNGFGSTKCFVEGFLKRKSKFDFWSIDTDEKNFESVSKLYTGIDGVHILNCDYTTMPTLRSSYHVIFLDVADANIETYSKLNNCAQLLVICNSNTSSKSIVADIMTSNRWIPIFESSDREGSYVFQNKNFMD